MSQLNETLELMQTRRSVRDFKPDMVPEDILDKIIDCLLYTSVLSDFSLVQLVCVGLVL